MKPIFTFLLIITLSIFLSNNCNAQFINSLSVYPTTPTTNDSIYLIASCYFQAGSCDQKTLNYSILNNLIDCDALHCIGMASFICYDQDTFSIGLLSAGNYSFHYTVNAGYGMQPCTPGIIAGPTDSISFSVLNPTGIENTLPYALSISPNPCNDYLNITGTSIIGSLARVYDLNGRLISEMIIKQENCTLNTSALLQGAYYLRISKSSTIYTTKLFYKL